MNANFESGGFVQALISFDRINRINMVFWPFPFVGSPEMLRPYADELGDSGYGKEFQNLHRRP